MFTLTNPDKFLYPELQITKKMFADFLFSVAPFMFPYVKNRFLALKRCPDGYKKECFFQKHLNQTNVPGIATKLVEFPSGIEPYFYLTNPKGFLYLAQMAALEIHPWGSHAKSFEKPDLMIFDLDPSPSVEWKKTVHLAHFMRSELEKLKLKSFVKTTGGKGLHIVVPIHPQHLWEEVKTFAHAFAKHVAQQFPQLCTDKMAKSHRRGKIFIDYVRNSRGGTAVAPYSPRARKGATVSTPLAWDELNSRISSDFYTIKNFPKRLKQIETQDPWKEFYQTKQCLKW